MSVHRILATAAVCCFALHALEARALTILLTCEQQAQHFDPLNGRSLGPFAGGDYPRMFGEPGPPPLTRPTVSLVRFKQGDDGRTLSRLLGPVGQMLQRAYLHHDYESALAADEVARRLVYDALIARPVDVAPYACGHPVRSACERSTQHHFIADLLLRLGENQLRLFVLSGNDGHLRSALRLVDAVEANPSFTRARWSRLDVTQTVRQYAYLRDIPQNFYQTPEEVRLGFAPPSHNVALYHTSRSFDGGQHLWRTLLHGPLDKETLRTRGYANVGEAISLLIWRSREAATPTYSHDLNMSVLRAIANLRPAISEPCEAHYRAQLDLIEARARLRLEAVGTRLTLDQRELVLRRLKAISRDSTQGLLAWRARLVADAFRRQSYNSHLAVL